MIYDLDIVQLDSVQLGVSVTLCVLSIAARLRHQGPWFDLGLPHRFGTASQLRTLTKFIFSTFYSLQRDIKDLGLNLAGRIATAWPAHCSSLAHLFNALFTCTFASQGDIKDLGSNLAGRIAAAEAAIAAPRRTESLPLSVGGADTPRGGADATRDLHKLTGDVFNLHGLVNKLTVDFARVEAAAAEVGACLVRCAPLLHRLALIVAAQ